MPNTDLLDLFSLNFQNSNKILIKFQDSNNSSLNKFSYSESSIIDPELKDYNLSILSKSVKLFP